MEGKTLDWIACTDSEAGLRRIFGDDVPPLDQLDLAQCLIGGMGEVKLSLNFTGLPAGSPARWHANGCDCIQFRMAFYDVHEFKMIGEARRSDFTMRAAFGSANTFELANSQFRLELKYGYVTVDIYPYNSTVFEEPEAWFHQ